MQRVTIVRYTAKPDQADENEVLSRAVFAELHEKGPPGIAYVLCRVGDEFMHIFVNFDGDESEPLTGLPSFKAFSAEGPSRCVAPPEVVRKGVNVLEAYGFERTSVAAVDGQR